MRGEVNRDLKGRFFCSIFIVDVFFTKLSSVQFQYPKILTSNTIFSILADFNLAVVI